MKKIIAVYIDSLVMSIERSEKTLKKMHWMSEKTKKCTECLRQIKVVRKVVLTFIDSGLFLGLFLELFLGPFLGIFSKGNFFFTISPSNTTF